MDKESEGAKKPREVKFAVETMEMNKTVKNKLKDARNLKDQEQVEGCKNLKDQEQNEGCKITMDAYCGLISANCRNCRKCGRWMDNSGTRRDH